MTSEILDEVSEAIASAKSETDASIAAEKLCAAKQVEFHPLACDLVQQKFHGEDAVCGHVSAATREAAAAAFDAVEVAAEKPRKKPKKAEK